MWNCKFWCNLFGCDDVFKTGVTCGLSFSTFLDLNLVTDLVSNHCSGSM